MKNKILHCVQNDGLKLSGSLKAKTRKSGYAKIFSGSLKYIIFTAILGLSVHFTYADDITNTNNYLPNGKYRLFGSGRGEVQNIDNQIRLHSQLSQQAGNLQIETRSYQGNLSYEQHFHNHGHRQHSPFSNTAQRNFSAKTGSVVQGGATLTDLSVTGYEIHPADAYDGEQGGGYPVPTGARDEYLYEVTGKEMSVKVVNLNTLPPTAKNDNQLLRQAGIDPERYNQPQTDDHTQIKRLTGSGENTGVYGDLSSNTNGWNAAQIRQPESLRLNIGYIAPRVISTPSPYSDNINGNGRIDEYANNIPKTTISTQFYNSKLFKDAENIRVNFAYSVPEIIVTPSPFSDNINGNGRIDEYANNIPKTTISTQFYNSKLFKDAENIRVNSTYSAPEIIVTPSPFSDNINGNGRIDEYAHDIPQIPVSWQPYTGNSNIQFDKNARLNVRFAVPQVTVTRSPYDRLNVDNSNYGKSTARKNNSSSQTNSRDNNHKSPTFDYNNYGYYNSDDNYYGYGGYDSYGDYGQGNNYSNLTEEKSTYKDDLWSVITSPPPPFTEYDDGTKNTVNNYPTNQIVEDEYDRLIKGFRNGTVGVAELLTTLGSLATDVITSVKGRSSNSVDSSLKNALLGDLKSINNLESASIITHAQANALRKAALNNKRILNNGDVKIGGYKKISLDVEKGGSGKVNIHLQVDGKKYFYDNKTGNYISKDGNKLPNSIAKNSKIQQATDKALQYAQKMQD